jgi:hypothetical protein
MRTGWLALMLAFAASTVAAKGPVAPAAPAALETVASLQVEGELDIDAAGRVAAYRIATELPDEIRASLDRDIPAWRFEPIVEGEPMEAVTVAMTIALVARPAGDAAFAVQVEKVRLWRKQPGPITAVDDATLRIATRKLKPPQYPDAVREYGLDAAVLVAVLLDTEGNVVEAEVLQSALYNVNGKEANLLKALSYFERSVIAGARRWRFDVAAHGAPTADDLTVIVPVRYHFDTRKVKPGDWQRLSRTPMRRASWQVVPDEGIGIADVTGDGPLPGRAPLRMARPAGAALP